MGNCCMSPAITEADSKILLIDSKTDIKLLEYLKSKLVLNNQVLEM